MIYLIPYRCLNVPVCQFVKMKREKFTVFRYFDQSYEYLYKPRVRDIILCCSKKDVLLNCLTDPFNFSLNPFENIHNETVRSQHIFAVIRVGYREFPPVMIRSRRQFWIRLGTLRLDLAEADYSYVIFDEFY